jgi:hypothetical protein
MLVSLRIGGVERCLFINVYLTNCLSMKAARMRLNVPESPSIIASDDKEKVQSCFLQQRIRKQSQRSTSLLNGQN